MALYQATPGVADPVKFTSSMTAFDLALTRAFGSGVLSGLTVDGSGTVAAGEALIGHVVALAAPQPSLLLCAPNATNYVYLQMPAAPVCVGTDGRDAGALVVNQTGTLPPRAVLLATITTGAGSPPAITSFNTNPSGRVNLGSPITTGGGSGGSGATGSPFRGPYNSAALYAMGDVVRWTDGALWQCILASMGHDPSNATYWTLYLPAGATGAPGPEGEPGPQGPRGLSSYNPRGPYDPAATYAANDTTFDPTGGYLALLASTGIALSDTSHWIKYLDPGPQGIQGPSTFNPRGDYSATTTYAVNDVVRGSGGFYLAVAPSTNQMLSNGTYWFLMIPPAPPGQNGQGLNPAGEWSSGGTYHALDIVTHSGSVYVALVTSTNVVPGSDTSKWQFWVSSGAGGSPASSTTSGTVLTDITESGGSRVYTKTTMDTLLAAKLSASSNLSDLVDASAARTNLGLGTAATHADSDYEHVSGKGQPSGYASLDSSGKIPTAQLPASVMLGAVDYQGVWNAGANSPALASGTGTKGFYYKVSTAGATTLDGNTNWHPGDWAVYDGSAWEKIDNYEAVTSVNGQIGAVVIADATTSQDGLMSAADKVKLNGIAAGATAHGPATVSFGYAGTLSTGLLGYPYVVPTGITLTLTGIRLRVGGTPTAATTITVQKSTSGINAAFSAAATSQSLSTASSAYLGASTDTITTAMTFAAGDLIDIAITAAGAGASGIGVELIFSYSP